MLFEKNMPGSDHEDGEEKAAEVVGDAGADAYLRDFRYNIQCQLMAHERDLKVRVVVAFWTLASSPF